MGRRLREALRGAVERLADTSETPRLDAEILLGLATGLTRAELLAHPERGLTPAESFAFDQAVERRARGEPVAYVVGRKEFYGVELVVDGRVLIPRPETETLVERALNWVRGDGEGCVVADVGTGSGSIALAVAARRPRARVVATDTSERALAVARENAHRVLGEVWSERVEFRHGPLLAGAGEQVNVVCANLPYIPTGELAHLPVSVRDYEPWSALDGGPDGLDAYRGLLADVPGKVTDGGVVLMECDPGQAEALLELGLAALPGSAGEILRDLAGDARVVEVRR